MALTISQISAASYPAVLNEMRKPSNQWEESALLREFERQGMIDHVSFGPTIELTLDVKRNPGTDFLATDMTPTSLAKTDILTAASYTPAELSVPVTWSKGDDAKNPTENQKVALVKSLLENGIRSHDDAIEEALFASSTDGFLGLVSIIPTTGQGTVGGIDASVETMWRNPTVNYASDGSDMEAQLTSVWNSASKGSGSALSPRLLASGASAQALFESTQVPLQRYADSNEMNAGFKVLAFKSARYVFSQYGGVNVFMANPKSLQLKVSKQYFRDKGDTRELESANAFSFKIYSALQLVTGNKSRLGIAVQV
jgi:hypothetical protein